MKHHITISSLCLLTVLTFACTQIFTAKAQSMQLNEVISINVNCDTAVVDITSTIQSDNSSNMHFPSEIDLNSPNAENVTNISLTFSDTTTLIYILNISDTTTATSVANALTVNMSTAFDTTYTYQMAIPIGGMTYVYYEAPEKSDLPTYMGWLMPRCLATDLAGFSLTFIPNTQKPQASILFIATRETSTIWLYTMSCQCETSAPTGSGNLTIDVLNLLGVSSLAPSPHATWITGFYLSTVSLEIDSSSPITYISCQPGESNPPLDYRGWEISTPSGTSISGSFSFGDDPSPVDPLTLTFNGTIVPEFTPLTLLGILALATTIAAIMKKKLQKTPN